MFLLLESGSTSVGGTLIPAMVTGPKPFLPKYTKTELGSRITEDFEQEGNKITVTYEPGNNLQGKAPCFIVGAFKNGKFTGGYIMSEDVSRSRYLRCLKLNSGDGQTTKDTWRMVEICTDKTGTLKDGYALDNIPASRMDGNRVNDLLKIDARDGRFTSNIGLLNAQSRESLESDSNCSAIPVALVSGKLF